MRTAVLLAAFGWNAAAPAQTTWGKTDHKGEPWVKNSSRPFSIENGLEGRHLSVWASHGRYFDQIKDTWKWQRPSLFCTNEDLYTQTIVVPYLIPMLENAGAVVFTPRERDWQRHEVVVDNDDRRSLVFYRENSLLHPWATAPAPGFAFHEGPYHDQENPFAAGSARMAATTRSKSKLSTVNYQPDIPEEGRYAVYVSYQTVEGSIDDAAYTVWHKGQRTDFKVNQQMGGSTWVYLGTFEFDKGCSERNRVELTNKSSHRNGVVTTDAVRFGGGMGNIERGGTCSGYPRCLEGARYYAQWAGMPYSVYSSKNGVNDYADDINARSLMTNLLTGGSCYAPDSVGRRVPIELSLAVHSDAGHTDTGLGVYGTLTICTTGHGDPTLATGMSRQASLELATDLLNNTTADLQYRYGEWTQRTLYDRNYSETRLPVVPSAILETMSHQNFGDMRYGQDPNFRFTLARSIYKTLLRYITSRHGEKCVVQPLPPDNFHIEMDRRPGEVRISWQGLVDGQEPTSTPTGYILYIATDGSDFDNGTPLRGTSCSVSLIPGVLYNFKVTAVNDGGQSFPTETLSALYNPTAQHTVMVVNGFHRLASPAVSRFGQGFDIDEDAGVSYGPTAGLLGRQQVFDPQKIGIEDSTGLGYSTDEFAGMFIAGNSFNNVRTHAKAIQATGRFNIVSCSAQAVENGSVTLSPYAAVDLLLGLEKDDGYSLGSYKTLRPLMRAALDDYTSAGGRLMVSGAYVASDQTTEAEKQWLADVLKAAPAGNSRRDDCVVSGLGSDFSIVRQLNERHYAATHTDVLAPVGIAFPAMVYQGSQTSAAVAYQGVDYNAFTMGFPFECITDEQMRAQIMSGILNFLINK